VQPLRTDERIVGVVGLTTEQPLRTTERNVEGTEEPTIMDLAILESNSEVGAGLA
jgi:hypothetical protein